MATSSNCPRCGMLNPATAKFCMKCGQPLGENATRQLPADELARLKGNAGRPFVQPTASMPPPPAARRNLIPLLALLGLVLLLGFGAGSFMTSKSGNTVAATPVPVVAQLPATATPPQFIQPTSLPTTTPVPRQPTDTSVPPTNTPVPMTDTPAPPTPIPGTAPGTILEVGQGWLQDGWKLRLTGINPIPDRNTMQAGFELSNLGSEPRAIRYGLANFSAKDSQGRNLHVGSGESYQVTCNDTHTIINPGEALFLEPNCPSREFSSVALQIDVTDPAINVC